MSELVGLDNNGLRPLKRDYFREPVVVGEIRQLLEMAESARMQRFEETKRSGDAGIAPESLVYFLREYYRSGDDHCAGVIMEALARRVMPSARKMLFHTYGLTADPRQPITGALFAELYL